MKTRYWVMCGIFGSIVGILWWMPWDRSTRLTADACPFCSEIVLDAQKFYEDELVLALVTHKPVMEGHCLIIPKRHVERFECLSEAEVARMHRVLQKLDRAAMRIFDTSSYLLLQKNGREVGQTVPHVHIHYIPRRAGDESIVKFLFNMFWVNMLKPLTLSEMQGEIAAFRTEISQDDMGYNY